MFNVMHHSLINSPQHEPMVMGSPPSPSAGNYLPGYLMGGDSSFHGSTPYMQSSRGPTTGHLASSASASPLLRSLPPQHHQQQAQQQQQRSLGASQIAPSPSSAQRKRAPNLLGMDSRGRQAPPTSSLWATPPPPPAGPGRSATPSGPMQDATSPPRGHSTPWAEGQTRQTPGPITNMRSPVRSLFRDFSMALNQSSVQLESDSYRLDDSGDERWVTIFGYPQKAATFVIDKFSHCGTITKYVIENEGNWAHLKFQTKLQARKALSKNGKLLAENFMVGVKPCSDKRIMADDDGGPALEPSLDLSGIAPGCRPPGPTEGTTLPSAQASVLAEQSLNCSMRSLTARGGPPGDVSRLRAKDIEEPSAKDRDGLFSKAFGYLFGWN